MATVDEKTKDDKTNKLLEALAVERAARKEAEAKLSAKELQEQKERDPMSGPGKLCESWKITLAEALQLKWRIVNTPDGRQEERPEECPKGYQVRQGSNASYLVRFDNEDPQRCAYLPSCESKYTTEESYFLKKPVTTKIDQDPPKGKIHLCEHHRQVLLGR